MQHSVLHNLKNETMVKMFPCTVNFSFSIMMMILIRNLAFKTPFVILSLKNMVIIDTVIPKR